MLWWFLIASVAVALYVSVGPFRWAFHKLRVYHYFSKTHVRRHLAGSPMHEHWDGKAHPMPRVGEMRFCDFTHTRRGHATRAKGPIRVVSWNIEMGYQCSLVVEELLRLEADVVLLQEVDIIGLDGRTKDAFLTIGKALGMYGVYCGHHAHGNGIWGNAVFTRFPMVRESAEFIPLSHLDGYDRSALAIRVEVPHHLQHQQRHQRRHQPRRGNRRLARGHADPSRHSMVVCSVHLEVCCGMTHRVDQMKHVARMMVRRMGVTRQSHLIIGGDLNTMGDSILRLSPFHCCDPYRVGSIGWSEAQWWSHRVFAHPLHPKFPMLRDPFTCDHDGTLAFTLPILGIKYVGKLDWLLYTNQSFKCTRHWVGKGDQSDHRWVMAELCNE